ncbi:MoaD/ThiS family protein [Cellulomonas shaoxiangyii]|uniref:MoaD/ThiS family protein n=1 Tax=Cellulomonas shaoxiangyii TaxID=2566013 RepID=A0A4P7SMD9_9CELL|nr:MoaD/ThiS family protein [Cellulomonas shaoxiangyii]TGY76635.1 MoaD/ThiS family protein [Cellulomonas shaoxiangyii]
MTTTDPARTHPAGTAPSPATPAAATVPAPAGGAARSVAVRYFAAAHEAAGVAEERVDVAADATVGSFLDALAARHGGRLRDVLAVCALLVDGALRRDRDEPLGAPAVVDVLPPFAGG